MRSELGEDSYIQTFICSSKKTELYTGGPWDSLNGIKFESGHVIRFAFYKDCH